MQCDYASGITGLPAQRACALLSAQRLRALRSSRALSRPAQDTHLCTRLQKHRLSLQPRAARQPASGFRGVKGRGVRAQTFFGRAAGTQYKERRAMVKPGSY